MTYFDAPGRAEPIRTAFHIAGIDFEDHRLKFPDFMARRAQGEFPLRAVPVLAVDGVQVVQTAAILRYVAKIADTGLYPADAMRALIVDSALDSINDTLSHALMPSFMEQDAEKRRAMRAAFVEGPMTRVFTYIEGLLNTYGGPFLGGDALSIADLVLALQVLQIRSGGLDDVAPDVLTPYPLINALTDAYQAEPRIQACAKSSAR